ncbi:unnamed protein product [Rangifer tarandus platyrhynchus]|uniref:Uncharacterized protein n=2 Tax=Rangifer tarandus platyrhynchus TaxID=3082113 RepID=A0ACB0EMC8_RANTA|nr:unnamed protein product [Rangifer tarandus platyrhynchus]CAI9701604.1 unnamed protein product [Rangifer tarandus platyrhynchus]
MALLFLLCVHTTTPENNSQSCLGVEKECWKPPRGLPIPEQADGLTSPVDSPRPRRANARRARSFADGNAREASQSIQRGLSPEPHRDDSSSRESTGSARRRRRWRTAGGGRAL